MKTTQLTKEQMINFALEIKTLDSIRLTLELKGHSNMYVKNTNKKYGKNITATQELNDEFADIIVLNTLGKLNRLNEQYFYLKAMNLRDTSSIQEQIERIDNQTHAHNETLEKARVIVEKDNLANKIIDRVETLFGDPKTPSGWAVNAKNQLTKENEPNIEYIDSMDSLKIYSKKIVNLIELYKKG